MSRLHVPIGSQDHREGPDEAPMTLLEYGDFECPYCGEAYSIVERIRKAFGKRLRVVFRHFPLTQIHPHALGAAIAAEAAGLQGQFWPMHHLLYENQKALEPQELRGYAQSLGLNLDAFDRACAGDDVANRVRSDFRSGLRSGVNGTPTFFINGEPYDGPWGYDRLHQRLVDVLARV